MVLGLTQELGLQWRRVFGHQRPPRHRARGRGSDFRRSKDRWHRRRTSWTPDPQILICARSAGATSLRAIPSDCSSTFTWNCGCPWRLLSVCRKCGMWVTHRFVYETRCQRRREPDLRTASSCFTPPASWVVVVVGPCMTMRCAAGSKIEATLPSTPKHEGRRKPDRKHRQAVIVMGHRGPCLSRTAQRPRKRFTK